MATETVTFQTREEWLEAAVENLRPVLRARAGLEVPTVRVGVGFPSGGLRSNVGGQTWKREASEDGINEITIRVTVCDPVEVLAVLGHELIHAAMDCVGGHGKRFNTAFLAVGYTGSPKGCTPGNVLRTELASLSEALGNYPGDGGLAVAAEKKKQGTRMLRCECAECGFVFRTTQKWVAAAVLGLSCPDANCGGTCNVDGAEADEE